VDLCDQVVKHKVFGKGQIVDLENNYVTVLFDNIEDEKKFSYPSAFGPFLELEDKSFLKQVEKDKNIIIQREAENKKIEEKLKKEKMIKAMVDEAKHSKNTNNKASNRNNIAFKCNYCDGGNSEEIVGYKGACSDKIIEYNIKKSKRKVCSNPQCQCYKYLNGEISREELDKFYEENGAICAESQILKNWRAYTGTIQSGVNKGNPKKLRNITNSSLVLLTTRFPNAKDKDRFIFAVFLVDGNYNGNNKEKGYLGSDSKYKLKLSLNEAKKLKFWDYYFNPNKPKNITFGSGTHRYLTDIQAAQVLKRIFEIKKGTVDEEFSKEFLEYYCKIKNLEIDDIAVPEGALQR
jgi:hypothetical protein